MSSLWQSTRASLDDYSAMLGESLGKLKAAQAVDIAEVIEELKIGRRICPQPAGVDIVGDARGVMAYPRGT